MTRIIPLLEGVPITGSGGALGWSSVALISTGSMNILVDTGFHGNRHILIKTLEQNEIIPDEIDLIVLTHLHFDHCFNLDLFKKAKIVLSRVEYDYVKEMKYIDTGDVFVPDGILEMIEKRDFRLFDQELLLADNILCIHTPGHTPGSSAVLVDFTGEEKTAICGDLFKYAWEVNLLPDVPKGTFGDKEQLKASQKNILDMGVKRFICGHDRSFSLHGKKIIFDNPGDCELTLFVDTTSPKTTNYKIKLAE